MPSLEFEFPETKDKKDEGYICPCCNQFVKRYTRKLNSSMGAVLVLLWRSGQTGFIHVENFLKANNYSHLRADFHKLCWWNLLERKSGERDDGSKRNGYYKITGRGISFANGTLKVPKCVKIFNNKFEGFEGEEININDALGSRFSYNELMQK